jgi:amino acid transporter
MAALTLVVLLTVLDIRINARTQLVFGITTVLAVLVFAGLVIAKGGLHGQTLQPFTFAHTLKGGFSGVFYGLIFGVLSYIGFETAAVLGEETRSPLRSIPRSVVIATAFAILFYVITTYAVAIGIGVNNGSQWAADPVVVAHEAARFGGHGLAVVIEIGAILSAFVFGLASMTAVTRTLFAMGREGALPGWFGRAHARYQTPANAAYTVAILTVGVTALFGFVWDYGQGSFTVYGLFAGFAGLAFTVVYLVLCVDGIIWFKRTRARYNPILHAGIPLFGIVVFGCAIYGSIFPVPPMPFRLIPYAVVGWLLLGVAGLIYLARTRPESIGRIGTIAAEEGADIDDKTAVAREADLALTVELRGVDAP